MKIYKPVDTIPFKTSIAIGMFDGVHRGHQALIKKTVEFSKKMHTVPLIYTFNNHPVKEANRKYLTLLEERLYLIEKFDIEYVYLAELNEKFMSMSPETFVKTEICQKLNAKSIVVGKNFRFGKNRTGDTETLKKIAKSCGIETDICNLVYHNGKPISSSLIHNLINSGRVREANELLGYAFFLTGEIIRGKGIGRLLGFPTANMNYYNGYKVLPRKGVYITVAEVNGEFFKSITNVGFNPTFENSSFIKIEIHFIGEKLELYGKTVRLHFIQRIRDEKKFPSTALLIQQIQKDINFAKEFFKKEKEKKFLWTK